MKAISRSFYVVFPLATPQTHKFHPHGPVNDNTDNNCMNTMNLARTPGQALAAAGRVQLLDQSLEGAKLPHTP